MKSRHGCPDLSREILRKIKSRTGQALRDQPNPFNDFLKHVQLLTKACNIFLKLLFPCDTNWSLCGCANCKLRKFGYCVVHRSWGRKMASRDWRKKGWKTVFSLNWSRFHRSLFLSLTIQPGNGSVQFSSVTQSCPTLCDPMDCSTPGLSVHHQLSEFTQTHAHQVGDAIQPEMVTFV